jgi:hypothetical protein
MTLLFQRQWRRADLLALVGDISQLGGVRLVTLDDGPERGVRAAELRSGDGFNFTVLLDRGMDIGQAEYRGTPLAWTSPTGAIGPQFYEPLGTAWLRTFHGGLLCTCGLTQAGLPNNDQGEELGLHGRISHIPARQVAWGDAWEEDEYRFWISGQMREVSALGCDLRLTRRISMTLGKPSLTIEDRVENHGYNASPLMMLYHFNLGFPILSPESRLEVESIQVQPRDPVAASGLSMHTTFEAPAPDYAEQVFFHKVAVDQEDFARVRLVNRPLGLGVQLRYRQRELPELVEWKQVGQGAYVVGLEPANCRPEGRAAARQRGALLELAPGEAVEYLLEIQVIALVN